MANSRNSASADPLTEHVAAQLRRHLQPGQTVIVGLSGGRDSVALLHLLLGWQEALNFTLAACHVNHHLSPNASAWQNFCVELCLRLDIPLQISSVNVPRGTPDGLESSARSARYAIFKALRADWLMLGQHRADQAETLLFNLARGCGVRGASAMPDIRPLSSGLMLMRPLLDVGRAEIQRYLVTHRLAWVEDESNSDTRFTRNYLRHRLMPVLVERFPAAEQSLANAAARFAEAQQLLDELAKQDLGVASPCFPLPLAVLECLSEPRARNVLRYLLNAQRVRTPSEPRLSEFLRQILAARPDRHPEVILDGRRLLRRRGMLHLEVLENP